MTNETEARRWLKDAEAHFRRAERLYKEKDFQGVVGNAQIGLELSVKAIIACFDEPIWRHDPGEQLLEIVKERENELGNRFGKEILKVIEEITNDVDEAAPWHGWSVYGRKEPEGWVGAVDLCKEEIANDLLKKAERGFTTAQRFISTFY